MLRVALRRTYKTIPTTCWPRMKSTNIFSEGSRRRAWRRTITMCWRKTTLLCISESSKMGMVSSSSWLACQMIRLLGSCNYTLSRIWDGITITKAPSTTAVKTSPTVWDGWFGSQPIWSISLTPHRVASRAMRQRNASLPKCTLWTGGGRHREGEILEDNNVLIDVESTLREGDTLVLMHFVSDGTHLSNFVGQT